MDSTAKETLNSLILLIAAFNSIFITGGIPYSIGTYTVEWLNAFKNGSGVTAWLGSVNLAVMLCSGPLSGMMVNKWGFKRVIFVAGLLSSGGIVASAFATNVYVLIVTYGLITGLGFGMAHVPTIAVMAQSFNRMRTVMMAICMSATSLGMFILPIFVNFTVNVYGWRGSILILGGFALHLSISGLLIDPSIASSALSQNATKRPHIDQVEEIIGSITSLNLKPVKPRNKIIRLGMFKHRTFVLLMFHAFFVSCGYLIAYIHLSAAAIDIYQLDNEKARYIISAIGVSNLLGRVVQGAITHHPKVETLELYMVVTFLAGVFLVIFPFMGNYTGLMAATCGIGFSFAAYGCYLPCVIAELLETEYIAAACGYIMFSCGIGFLIGPPVAGMLYDYTGSYANSLYLGAGFVFLGIVVTLPHWLVIWSDACCAKRDVTTTPAKSNYVSTDDDDVEQCNETDSCLDRSENKEAANGYDRQPTEDESPLPQLELRVNK
ncbi:monocarboxylate transporter 13-like isoform X2 [Tubulanus polymorphus]